MLPTNTNMTQVPVAASVLIFSQTKNMITSSSFVKLEPHLETFFLPLSHCTIPMNLNYFRGIPS